MITNDGKEIISKYLIGQVPTFASHLSVGCGAVPMDNNDIIPNDAMTKKRMDFEIIRVPISSKGFVDDSEQFTITSESLSNNVGTIVVPANNIKVGEQIILSEVDPLLEGQHTVDSVDPNTDEITFTVSAIQSINPTPITGVCVVPRTKVSLSAELPTDNRYEITEVGIWSAPSNSLAGLYDSRMIFTFNQSWQLHGESILDPQLINVGASGAIDIVDQGAPAFFVATNDPLFQTSQRKLRKEGPRNSNKTLLVSGSLSAITIPNDELHSIWEIDPLSSHIHLNNVNFDISGNNPNDIMKLAFSMIDKTNVEAPAVDSVKIIMEFYKNESNTENAYAKAQIYVPGQVLDANRYYVANFTSVQDIDYSNEAQDLAKPYVRFFSSEDFSSSMVRTCRIFVDIDEQPSQPTSAHYIAFDGFRIDNITDNPTYKMSGYAIIRNNGYPITKSANSNNYVDFRFTLEV